MQGELAVEWGQYVNLLAHSVIKLSEEDQLEWSKNMGSREHTTKLGYSARIEDFVVERVCWWRVVWKLVCPLKSNKILWLSQANKILIWDMNKRETRLDLVDAYYVKIVKTRWITYL